MFASESVLVGITFVVVCIVVSLSGSNVLKRGIKDFHVWVVVLGSGADGEMETVDVSVVILVRGPVVVADV